MRAIELSFRKVRQVAAYEPEEVVITVAPEGTPIQECLAQMKSEAEAFFGEEAVAAPVATKPAAVKKAPAKKDPVKEAPATEETATEETVATTPPAKEVKKAPAKKAPAKKAPKMVPYDRKNDTHKHDFASILRKVDPRWNKDPETKKLGQAMSRELVGIDMYDAEGSILAEFEAKVKEGLSS